MVSEKLKAIFFLSIPFFLLNAAEEFVTLFYRPDFVPIFPYPLPSQESFLASKLAFYLVVTIYVLLLKSRRLPLFFMIPFSITYIFQLEHPYFAIILKGYYPGLISGLVLIVLGLFFFVELVQNLRKVYF